MNSITRQIVEDLEALPPQMQDEALDFVRFLKAKLSKLKAAQDSQECNGNAVVEILNEIAGRGTAFKDVDDPAAWQTEIRKDHPLPGRDK
ncbi:MAG: hypothetical protein CVV41_19560 [Candidatus Riflebacteria bacterium HGW-Riflebacteria-1]|jgi:hypothetical protein|nr:MAG: hypothetical protein CVV41_19560 [Candidatus Riflebacteria bacterium HGW-Riflebacteria-1]